MLGNMGLERPKLLEMGDFYARKGKKPTKSIPGQERAKLAIPGRVKFSKQAKSTSGQLRRGVWAMPCGPLDLSLNIWVELTSLFWG